MNPSSFKQGVILAVLAVALVFTACENHNGESNPPVLSVKVLSQPGCNNLKSAIRSPALADSFSCVNYSYNAASGKLWVKHLNTGFNCCPDSLYCKADLRGDSLIVQEMEKKAGCKCNCLFDLDMEISGLTARKYQVRFIEPYCGDQKPLIFEIDLSGKAEGSFCVRRNRYPWGI